MAGQHIRRFDTPPIVGQRVGGTSEGPRLTSTWDGIYEGVRASEWDGEPYHFFRDGQMNGTPQTLFGFPVAQTVMTRAQASAVLAAREGYEDAGNRSDEEVIAAAQSPEGQPCNDCGALVVYTDEDFWHHADPSTPPCFLCP